MSEHKHRYTLSPNVLDSLPPIYSASCECGKSINSLDPTFDGILELQQLQSELEEARMRITRNSETINECDSKIYQLEAQLSEKDAVIENIAKALNNLVAYHQPIEHPHIPNKACPFCIGKETLAEIGEK